jgi:hypothetical protein
MTGVLLVPKIEKEFIIPQHRPIAKLDGDLFIMCRYAAVVVRQIVVHHIERISFSLAEVLRFGIAC